MRLSASGSSAASRPAYPTATREEVVEVRHGIEVADPYRWLEDPASPETVGWLAAQRDLARVHAGDRATRRTWLGRLQELHSVGLVSPPTWRGQRQIVLRREPRQERSVVCLVEPDGAVRTLLDPTALDPTNATTVDRYSMSWDCRFLAYQTSRRGNEQSLLYVREVGSGEVVDGPIGRVRHAPVIWAPDSSGFWYVRGLHEPSGGSRVVPRRLFWHRLGADPAGDELIFGQGMPVATGLWPRLFHQRWLTVRTTVGTASQNALWLTDLRAGDPAGPVFHPVLAEAAATTAPAIGLEGRMYLRTTLHAPRGRVCAVRLGDPDRLDPEHWQEVIAEDAGSVLRSVVPVTGGLGRSEHLLVVRTRRGAGSLSLHASDSGEQLREVPLPGAGTASALSAHPDGARSVWMLYTDHITPDTVLRYDVNAHRLNVHARPPGTAPVPRATHRQVEYTSWDGTRVPMLLVAPRVCASGPDRPRPALLNGYGAFGVSMSPRYSAEVSAWTEAGGVVAVPCVRGGGEDGEPWHHAGTGPGKQRAIEDFIAAAQWLISHRWTTASRMAALGSSSGGLLVTAAMVQQPQLYRAVAAIAPLTDMLRYERSGLGPLWRTEYGTVDDPEQYAALLSYSPYHRVRRHTPYPAVLLVAPENDTRIDPMHSRKLCAALQDATSSGSPVLLRTLPDTGHGASARSQALAVTAEVMAFLAEQTGLDLAPTA